LAYSTISHVGFILLSLISYSIDSEKAFIFYIIQYTITNLNAFVVVIAIGITIYLYYTNSVENNNLAEKSNSPVQLISQLKGYFSINPLIGLCLVVTMFSFVGLPPLAGFFGKQMVLATALDNHRTILVIGAILTSVIGAVYYLSIIRTIYFDKSEYGKSYTFNFISVSNTYSITIGILTLVILAFILIPNEIIDICNLLCIISLTDETLFAVDFPITNLNDFHQAINDNSDLLEKHQYTKGVRNLEDLPSGVISQIKTSVTHIGSYAKEINGDTNNSIFNTIDEAT